MTLVPDGSNLPSGAWVLAGKIELGPVNRGFPDTIELELAIEQDGFYLYGGGSGDVPKAADVRAALDLLLRRLE